MQKPLRKLNGWPHYLKKVHAVAQIFLCHASEDKARVRDVYRRLQAFEGLRPWLDEEDILPGQVWEDEIPRALKESDFILIFLSQNSVAKRGYVQREMRLALDALQDTPPGTIHTIPVRLDDCDVPDQFRRYQYANLFDERGFERIIQAIHAELAKRAGPTPATDQHDAPTEPESLPPTRLIESIGMELTLIPANTFMMGTPREQLDAMAGGDKKYCDWIENETPNHQVKISRPFYLGKYPVTQRQWEMVMGDNPSKIKGDDLPVETVSWNEAQAFMEKLNEREGVDVYRLPSEAEWEYAARAGSSTIYSFGNDEAQLNEYAWYAENSDGQTHPVGQKRANAWGLYDMYGNVWEWVQDWYGNYTAESATDPIGPDTGARRVFRGGGWSVPAQFARSAFRNWLRPGLRSDGLGFRCLSSGREPASGAQGKP